MTEPCATLSEKPCVLRYGFCGFAGSGKNAVGKIILDLHEPHAEQRSFAEPLKDAVATIFQLDREMLEGTTPDARSVREQMDEYWSEAFDRQITPRRILQEFGTDVCRSWLPDIWIHATSLRMSLDKTTVVTDTRFGNEMAHMREKLGAAIVWVYRPDTPAVASCFDETATLTVAQRCNLAAVDFASLQRDDPRHASETSFLAEGGDQLHVVLINDGTPKRLHQLVRHLDFKLRERITDPNEFSLGVHPYLPYGTSTLYLSHVDGDFVWESPRESRQGTLTSRVIFNSVEQFVCAENYDRMVSK